MVTKRKTLAIVGHSNGNGLAGVNEALLAQESLFPGEFPFAGNETKWVYKNIWVWTEAHGWASPDGTPPFYTLNDGAWLELTWNNPLTETDPHPHPSPYRYPNNTGWPMPNWRYQAELYNPSIDIGTGPMAGVEIPLMWKLSNYWQGDVGLIKLSIPGSTFLRYDIGIDPFLIFDPYSYIQSPAGSSTPRESAVDPDYGHFAWWSPSSNFDWAPNTQRLYSSFFTKANAAKTALAGTSTEMSIEGVVAWFGDNDCARGEWRTTNFEHEVREWVKKFRQDLVDNELTDLPVNQIPIVWMGIHSFYSTANPGLSDEMNAALQRVVADDPYMRYQSTDDYEVHDDDPGHLTYQGYLDASEDIFEHLRSMDVDPYDSMDLSQLLTVAEVKERVRLYYSRASSQTDIDDAVLMPHINASMHHVCVQCGDSAYWLRRRASIPLAGGSSGEPETLPRYISRVITIEDVRDPTYFLDFEMVGHADGGKLQIILKNQYSGTYTVQYIRHPRDLTQDDEKVPIPPLCMEWLIVEVCLRLSRASANPLHVEAWRTEAARLMGDVLKHVTTTHRARRDRLYTQRRLPDVLNRRGRRRWGPLS